MIIPPRMAPHVLVVGYLSIDTISTDGQTIADAPGGAALYAALGARAAGANVSIVACAGEDYPAEWLALMTRLGIDISRVRHRPGPTRRARLVNTADGGRLSAHHDDHAWWERTFALAPEAVVHPEADFLVLAPMPPELAREVVLSARCPIVADTSAAYAGKDTGLLMALVSQIACFAPSLEETRLLLPGLDDSTALRRLAASGPDVVQKRGADGLAFCAAGDDFVGFVPPAETRLVDPTGAGDATVGALATGLAHGLSLQAAATMAAGIGARTVSGHGPSALGFDWPSANNRVLSDEVSP